MRSVSFILPFAVGLLACSSPSGSASTTTHDGGQDGAPTPTDEGAVIYVGVEADNFVPAINASLESVVVTTTIDGLPPQTQTLDAKTLPTAIKVATTKERSDAKLEVTVEGKVTDSGAINGPAPIVVVSSLAATRFVPGQTKLLRLHLSASCAIAAPATLGGSPPSLGPRCAPPQTCAFGRCADSAIAPDGLEAYDPAWASHERDLCRTSSGAPELAIGIGAIDFAALADGATVTPTLGPQGGYMVLVEVQTKNIGQYGTKTTIGAAQPGSALTVPTSGWATPYGPDGAGACEIYGQRIVLDNGRGSMPTLSDWVNKPLDITVDVVDTYGTHLTQTKRVVIAQP